ncbi:hypothetical protein [Kitasatospora sp. NPDC057223]|uniref:hypothetical protein n=1 Tax=Kitasatospora sp. NPDC057223 TaxID=3346055 RepID=UPI00362D8DF4
MTVVTQTQDVGTTADEPLLSYALTTTPNPLKASPENPQAPEETGEIVITVARQSGTPADVQWIRAKVPAGTMSPDLTTDLNKITPRISLTGWTVRLDSAAKEFVFEPAASHAPIGPDTGLTLQLSDIPISRKVGTAPITVTESSRTGTAAFKPRETIFQVGKFPTDFYLRNFLCAPSVIPNGGNVHLSWERSANATYELLYGDVNRDVTNKTSLDIEGIKSDTTFYLRGTAGDPTNPVVRILSAQVTVIKPDLDLRNLTADKAEIKQLLGTPRKEAAILPSGGVRTFDRDGIISGNVNINWSLTGKTRLDITQGEHLQLWVEAERFSSDSQNAGTYQCFVHKDIPVHFTHTGTTATTSIWFTPLTS